MEKAARPDPAAVVTLMGALEGKTVVVTRASHQAGEFVRLLEERGAKAVAIPTIDIVAPESWEQADEAVERLGEYGWVIFTSVNGVNFFLNRLKDITGGVGSLKGHPLCAVGPKTRDALSREGLTVDVVPAKHVAEGIIDALGGEELAGQKVLLPRAAEGRDVLPEALRARGAEVDVVTVYRNIRPALSVEEFRDVLSGGRAAAITFTSASTVRNFAALFPEGEAGRLLEGVAVACIGPVTAGAARDLGVIPAVMPEEYTIPALAEALEEFLRQEA
jgi:uroporphyrinogen III methyltransferase/synthase